MAQHFEELETAIDAFFKAHDERKSSETQATKDVLSKLGSLSALLGVGSTAESADGGSEENNARGLAHFQNAALQFAGALIAASLIGLANAGRIDATVRIAGLTVFEAITHLLGFLITGTVIVTLMALVTQVGYPTLKNGPWFWSQAGGIRIVLVAFSVVGAAIMALAGSPFFLGILGAECSGQNWFSLCQASSVPAPCT